MIELNGTTVTDSTSSVDYVFGDRNMAVRVHEVLSVEEDAQVEEAVLMHENGLEAS